VAWARGIAARIEVRDGLGWCGVVLGERWKVWKELYREGEDEDT
jgi:hypothetical protein